MGTTAEVSSNREQLVTALRDATVALSAGTKVGTGLFIASGLVLTCAHVVEEVIGSTPSTAHSGGSRLVQGEWRKQPVTLEVLSEWFRPKEDGGPDLALLRVRGELAHPVACLSGTAEPGDELWAYGYPDGLYRGGDPLTFTFEGPAQRIDGAVLYRAAGSQAVGGFSGSPVLNWRTGMVCGIIRLAESPPAGPALVRLTPITVVLDTFPDALQHTKGSQQCTWLDLLDDNQLRAAGSRYPGPWLRSYLEAARHADKSCRASGDNLDAPGLLEVYQHPLIRDHAGRLAEVTDAGIGERDLLVVGDPGAGKSSLLRWVRHQAAQALLAGEDVGYVPVLVPTRVLAEQRAASFPEAIVDAVTEELGRLLDHPPPSETFTREPLPGTPWLMLIDGFEEILTPELRHRAIDAFAYWNSRPHLKLLVTSRPLDNNEFEPFSKKGVFPSYLAPFDLERVRRFTLAWLTRLSAEGDSADAAQRARSLVDRIEHGQIGELARNPLVTAMLCILHAADSNRELPESRYELYDMFASAQLDRQLAELGALPRLSSISGRYPGGHLAAERLLDGIPELLTAFALRRHHANEPTGGLAAFAQSWTAELRPRSFPASRWTVLVMDVLRQSGLVIGDRFWHQTFADFLAAREIARNPSGNDVTPEDAAQLPYMARNRSFLSFLAAGWARHCLERLRSFCEILSRRPPMHLQFFATLADDGVEIPPDILEQVSATLATAANNPAKDPETRVISAAMLSRLDRPRALPRLRLLALDPRTDASFTPVLALNKNFFNVDATSILMQVDPESALAVASAQAADPHRPAERRLKAAHRLLELDPALGIAALSQLSGTSSIQKEIRLEGLRLLAQADTTQALELAGTLATETDLAVGVALAVSDFAPGQALDTLADLASDPSLTPTGRTGVALRWARLRPGNHEPCAILESLAADHSLPGADRLEAATALSEVDPARAHPLLKELTDDRSADTSVRARAATLLMRLRPQQVGVILESLGGLNHIKPQVAVDLFTECARTSTQETVPALAAYLRAMDTGPGDDLDQRQTSFPTLAQLLREADPTRCAAEMDKIIHEPSWGTLRHEAEQIWAELEPERCADHLVEVVRGRCLQRGDAEKVRRFLGASGELGHALLFLVDLRDQRGAALAEAILQTFNPGTDHSAPELCLYAARAIAKLDRNRGVNLMIAMASDNRLDGEDRLSCAMELMWWDENRAAVVLTALARDDEVQKTAGIRGSGLPNMADMVASGQILAERIQDTNATRSSRETAIQQLLILDPGQTLETIMQLTDNTDQEERQWALQRLSKALNTLEITLPGYNA
jgi:Trypsin-like peptidase domain/NACHT domain